MYNIIIVIGCLILLSHGVTDTSTLKCPSQYNVTLANVTITSSAEIRNFFYSPFKTQEKVLKVETIVITDDKNQQLQPYLVQLAIPYIIILVASFIFFLIVICCSVFEKSCPPCDSWRRDFVRRPYSKLQLRCVMIFSLIFSMIILGVSIFAFTIIPNMKTDIQYTKCSLYLTLDIAQNGDIANGWGGFTQLKQQIDKISNLLPNATASIPTIFVGDEWLIDGMVQMQETNLKIYKNNKDATLITPDPVQTANTISGNPFPPINSVFITTGLGPNGTFNTMVDEIDQGLRTTKTLSDQAYAIDTSAKQMVQSASIIQANTVNSQRILQMYKTQLDNAKLYLDIFTGFYFDNLFTWVLYLIQATIGFILAASLLILLGITSTHFFDILQCRSMVHLGWVIYGISHFAVILIIYITLSVGSIPYESCNYINNILTNQSQFKRIGDNDPQNPLNRIDVCIYGDGNVLNKFSIAKEMQTVTNVFSNIATLYDFQTSSSVNYIDKTISTNRILGWSNAMEKYRLGVYKDSYDNQTADTNPNFALDKLNTYTNYDPTGSVTTCSKDRWVFDSTNCTIPTQTTYIATNDDNHGIALSSTNVICISFNEKLSIAQPTSWTQADFKRRYIQIKNACPGAYQKIIQYGQSLINFRNSRLNLFKGVKDQLDSLHTLNMQFNSNLTTFRGKVDTFFSQVSQLNNLVTNQLNGLLVTSDCRVIKNNLIFFYNTFCINYMERNVQLGIVSIILAIVMIGGLLTSNVFATRYARIQKDKKVNIVDISDASDDYHLKKENVSQSSSSSEDD